MVSPESGNTPPLHICGLKRWNTDVPMGQSDLEAINWRADETGGCVSLALAAAVFMFC